jgi:hypothetical protein|tara:strand:+ start:1810 stop:1980 length:171 start_codon:yes stop_codon:yes gene_type:complete
MEDRVAALERDVVALKVETTIQFRELFNRVKRLEAVLVASSGATIVLLLTLLSRLQ